ncbi:hypothetical protein VTK73DRAFT_9552 [Phialemonium thermophilum]|uniref:Uncharacterized protein n=1 Tax=Phialemonium thermophilum TaxID=223376 RepID=A0ABR3W1V7_9PEZI
MQVPSAGNRTGPDRPARDAPSRTTHSWRTPVSTMSRTNNDPHTSRDTSNGMVQSKSHGVETMRGRPPQKRSGEMDVEICGRVASTVEVPTRCSARCCRRQSFSHGSSFSTAADGRCSGIQQSILLMNVKNRSASSSGTHSGLSCLRCRGRVIKSGRTNSPGRRISTSAPPSASHQHTYRGRRRRARQRTRPRCRSLCLRHSAPRASTATAASASRAAPRSAGAGPGARSSPPGAARRSRGARCRGGRARGRRGAATSAHSQCMKELGLGGLGRPGGWLGGLGRPDGWLGAEGLGSLGRERECAVSEDGTMMPKFQMSALYDQPVPKRTSGAWLSSGWIGWRSGPGWSPRWATPKSVMTGNTRLRYSTPRKSPKSLRHRYTIRSPAYLRAMGCAACIRAKCSMMETSSKDTRMLSSFKSERPPGG